MTRICYETQLMFGPHPLILDVVSQNGEPPPPATVDPSRLTWATHGPDWVRTRAPSGIFSAQFGIFSEPRDFFLWQARHAVFKRTACPSCGATFRRLLSSESLYIGGRRVRKAPDGTYFVTWSLSSLARGDATTHLRLDISRQISGTEKIEKFPTISRPRPSI